MIKSVCGYCGVGCGLEYNKNKLAGDTAYPVSKGNLCLKGASQLISMQTSTRLLNPQTRDNIKDDFALYTWDGYSQPEQFMKVNELNAEGIVDLDSYWLVLSDDGKIKRADKEASDGYRKCDRIRSKNSLGGAHPSVYFRARKFSN